MHARASASVTGELVTKLSPRSVADTVQRLVDVVTERGLEVFGVIGHSAAARAHGLELRDTQVVIFGNPVAGTPVMERRPLAALDLPLKVLVWQEAEDTRLAYTAPSALAARYDIPSELAAPLSGIDALTDAAAAP
jgi:uncharacterized protein (DUF302 family)